VDPIVLKPGGGEVINGAGNDVLFKAHGEHTGGAIGITEYTAAPGFPGPPAHVHRQMTDMQYFKELSKALAQESFSPDLVARLSAKYDIEFP
jgi:hypothetical protein